MSRRIQLRSRTVEVEGNQRPLASEGTRQTQSNASRPGTVVSASGSRSSNHTSKTVRALEEQWRRNEELEELRRVRCELENQVSSIQHDISQIELSNRIIASRQSEDEISQSSGWSHSAQSAGSGHSRMLRTRTWIAQNTTPHQMCQQTAASRVRSQVSQSRTWVVEEVPQNARSIPLAVDSKPSPGVGVVTGASEQENPQPATAVSSDDIRYMVTRKNVSHELPEFNGDPTQWPLFKTMFDESTISARYSENENLLRLQKAVKGKAKEYLGKLIYLPGGLSRVMARLETRYGRPELIVREVMKNVKAIPTMKDDLSRAEKVAGEVDNIVSTIRLVGKSEYLANPILLDALLTKLSVNLRQQWGEYTVEMRGRPMDLGLFNDWLQDRVEAIGFMGESETAGEENSDEKRPKIIVQSSRTTQCMLCENVEHKQLEECPKFKKMSVERRCQYLAEGLLCFLCLKRGHRSMVCRSGRSCRTCKRRHHELLHTGNTENVSVHASKYGNDLVTPEMLTNDPSASTLAVTSIPQELRAESEALCLDKEPKKEKTIGDLLET
ncbi:hypothetical protein GE061_018686 [Apolygus lucorum]|uniref:Uncharacterized protein n=1 Tax=Apolygus lucorum TaxID=248454 RepID=A0A8S9XEQ6_APOLU|nr:hypothetical protein GE061_018686 [Apolygus lucorum]